MVIITENKFIQYEREAKILYFDDLSVAENSKKILLSNFQILWRLFL